MWHTFVLVYRNNDFLEMGWHMAVLQVGKEMCYWIPYCGLYSSLVVLPWNLGYKYLDHCKSIFLQHTCVREDGVMWRIMVTVKKAFSKYSEVE